MEYSLDTRPTTPFETSSAWLGWTKPVLGEPCDVKVSAVDPRIPSPRIPKLHIRPVLQLDLAIQPSMVRIVRPTSAPTVVVVAVASTPILGLPAAAGW